MSESSIRGQHWGTTPEERSQSLPCDDLVPDGQLVTRAVDTSTDPASAFRWLCQLRAAPYSYDVIDNFGRRSPQELTPGLDELEVGQRVMTIFTLAAFEPGVHLTLRMRRARRTFGDVAVTYAVPPGRILMRMRVRHPGIGPERRLRELAFPALDLVMARRQLLTLSRLAEIAPVAPRR